MATPGGESPTGVFYGIATRIQGGEMDVGGTGGLGTDIDTVGLASMTHD